MSTIRDIADIRVPEERIRKDFPQQAMEDLVASILSPKGLLHPPVVDKATGTLLCGERRFRAIQIIAERGLNHVADGKTLRPGLICTLDIKDLSPVDRLEAELEENTVRLDISWQEKAEATARLHELRQQQKELQTLPGIDPPKQSLRETAAEIRSTAEPSRAEVNDVRADILVATWLRNHPDDTRVANSKSRSEALKHIETTMEDEHRVALSRRFLRQASETSGHIIRLGDCTQFLSETPANVYDTIITDPPWGVGAHLWANGDATRRHSYLDDMAVFERIHNCLASDGFRVCKPQAHLYLFCSPSGGKFDLLRRMFTSAGWDVWPQPLIWFRGGNQGLAPRPEHGPRNTYEFVLFANKGNKRVLTLEPDVIFAPKPASDTRAAAKPVQIYWELLKRSVIPGDEILDPCCGSGPILPAATFLQCRATAYDIAEDAIGIASERLGERWEPVQTEITVRSSKMRGQVRQRTQEPRPSPE